MMPLRRCGEPHRSRTTLPAIAALAVILASGCEPECRKVPSLDEVAENIDEQVEDILDDLDATDEQRPKLRAIAKKIVPRIAELRRETRPRVRAIFSELKRDEPDRKRLTHLIDANIEANSRFIHFMSDLMLEGHRVLAPKQRKYMAEKNSKPSEAFEGSWMLDRGIDIFLSRLDATASQRALVRRIKADVLRGARKIQRKADALRLRAAAEFAKETPDREVIHKAVDDGRDLTRQTVYRLTGYYLLLSSKLDHRQREVLHTELVRFEPCPATKPPGQGARSETARSAQNWSM